MRVTATQAQFFAPLYMFARFAMCDRVVFMQEAQYSVKGGHSRLIFKAGEPPEYISVPVEGRGRKPIEELIVTQQAMWNFHHWLEVKYGSYPKFDNLYDWIVSRSNSDTKNLHEFNTSILKSLCDILAINCTFYNSKDCVKSRPENPTEWIVQLAQSLGADEYIQGKAGIDSYFEKDRFRANGIVLLAQDCKSPMPISESILSFLFFYGVTETTRIIKELSKQPALVIGI